MAFSSFMDDLFPSCFPEHRVTQFDQGVMQAQFQTKARRNLFPISSVRGQSFRIATLSEPFQLAKTLAGQSDLRLLPVEIVVPLAEQGVKTL
jgi:hypothetical protein